MAPLSHRLPCLAAALMAAAVLAAGLWFNNLMQQRYLERAYSEVRSEVSTLRTRLEGELNAAVYQVSGLANFVGAYPELTLAEFNNFASQMMVPGSPIRNVTLAPDNVIRFAYPLEGNESVVGLDLTTLPDQSFSIEHMMHERRTVVAGPVNLVQGDEALIVRTPIFLDRGERYWGMASVPINIDTIYERIDLATAQEQLAIALRGKDGLGAEGAVFHGDPALFRAGNVIQRIQFQGNEWIIAAAPREGWESAGAQPLHRWAYLALALLVLPGVVWLLMRQAWRLRESEARHRASEVRYRTLTESLREVVFQTDAQRRVHYINPAWTRITGWSQEETLGRDWVTLLHPDDRPHGNTACDTFILGDKDRYLEQFRVPCRDGSLRWMQVSAERVPDPAGGHSGTIGTMMDITDRKAEEDRIQHLAMHDNLTGLANRRLFEDRLQQAMSLSRRNGHPVALLFIDLDGFKPINDELGHRVGDQILQRVARRLEGLVRTTDTVARFGGDEFMVLLQEIDGPEEAERVAAHIIDGLNEPVTADHHTCQLGASIGISLFPEHGSNSDSLVAAADQAMYAAKHAGRGTYRTAVMASDTTTPEAG